ncbi:MAG: Autophagy protein 7 [Chrysothrix sp. TS-e1954]|nr:MAG: Autophagy protein 7 [Chrysothrix sp. TS-e1954]
MSTLQFAPWSSDLDLSFYSALASRKINHDRLDDAARKLVGRYELRATDLPEHSARMQFPGNALKTDDILAGQYRAEGILRNVNTLEEYKALDRNAIIDTAGRTIWDAICDGTIYSCPSLLSSFYAIFFADLKKYKFTYHVAFPAVHSDPPWTLLQDPSRLSATESSALFDAVKTWRYSVDQRQYGFFLAKRQSPPPEAARPTTPIQHTELDDGASFEDPSDQPLHTPSDSAPGPTQWIIAPISSFEDKFFADTSPSDRFVCFADPSTFPQNPGWMLRNLLALARQRWRLSELQVLCYRDTHIKRDTPSSLILNLRTELTQNQDNAMPKVTGWERNLNGKLNSRAVDLSEFMDPKRLADQSVDLNLKLMKWRIAPELDLDIIKDTRCLLLGSGTLGSYVSRNLLGWGVRKITFVDNGKVSFSNPVRQPLFNFEDCLQGGRKKAVRAAEALKEIYPGVDAQGFELSVPMPGHPVLDAEKTRRDFDQLKQLIDSHDAIFLLMDTRESRWLPTVMGRAAGKIVMNAALGFDTYVVMRHGAGAHESQTGDKPAGLGCYFCNDVVAPANSVKDQTLDQQCTVTRPGIASLASSLLVELLISLLQHPLKTHAPAPPPTTTSQPSNTSAPTKNATSTPPPESILGLVPHQIRGFLSSFSNLLISGPSYDSCSACSPRIISAYNTSGWDFVHRALTQRGYVEDLSGLAEVQRRAEEAAKSLELSDSDSNDAFDGEGDDHDDDGDGELL